MCGVIWTLCHGCRCTQNNDFILQLSSCHYCQKYSLPKENWEVEPNNFIVLHGTVKILQKSPIYHSVPLVFCALDKTLAEPWEFFEILYKCWMERKPRQPPVPPVPCRQIHPLLWNCTLSGQSFAPHGNPAARAGGDLEGHTQLARTVLLSKKTREPDLEPLNFWLTFHYPWKMNKPSWRERDKQWHRTNHHWAAQILRLKVYSGQSSSFPRR